jgi:hypothetical protein
MKFIRINGYTVKIGREEAHQKWLIENEERIRKASPPGVRYIGTFGAVLSSEKSAGGYRAMWELDSYGAMDVIAATAKDPDSDWLKLGLELSMFIETDWNLPYSNELLKNVVDATIWDPKS